MASHTRNPTGKNQHNLRELLCLLEKQLLTLIPLASADDATLKDALLKYHREKLTNNRAISERLKAEYNIIMRYDGCTFENVSNTDIYLVQPQ